MGQTLSEPVVEKHSTSGGDNRFVYGASAMQGWRITMEDAHTTILKLSNGSVEVAFFAVFDGHGGQNVAKFCGSNLHQIVARTPEFKAGSFADALKKGFLDADVELRNDPNFAREPSGCTAVSVLITEDRIFVANAGDSRAVLSAGGRAQPLSYDHKPSNEKETARIIEAGGFVEFGRVNGNLALSRAIGDFEFKQSTDLAPEKQIVTASPDVEERPIATSEDEFIVLACDGIWDCMNNQEVVDFVSQKIYEKNELDKICEMLMDRCLAPDSEVCGVGCDNMTVVIVGLLHGRTKEQWQADIKKRVEKQGGISIPSELQRRGTDPMPSDGIN
ncbi:Protein phosphatase 2C 2 [Polyrhizophydium stewartii]|uniref:protein-serine/threonine phosphatase n=1 Tax=Polyrhizophydium stewartii TaxID=2732419 RepID=A0ABR4NKZ0_9FUNG|nr:Protein phosphatase 2C 2 [Polyrhizophydium stewartii]